MQSHLTCLLLLAGLLIVSCKKDTDSDNNDSTKCPRKYEGLYTGSFVVNGFTLPLDFSKIAVLTSPGSTNNITFVAPFFPDADTITATLDCELTSFSFSLQSGVQGYGTFSADGNTLSFHYTSNTEIGEGTLVKTKSNGFVVFTARDISVDAGQNATVPVSVKKYGDYNQEVTLSTSTDNTGLHSALTITSGTPPFTSALNISVDSSLLEYIYDVSVKGIAGSDTLVSGPVITVTNKNCPYYLAGPYQGTLECWFSSNNNAGFYIEVLSPAQIKFVNFMDYGTQVLANVNCQNQEISIPTQTVNSAVVAGAGYFSRHSSGDVSLNIDFSWQNPGLDSCSVHFHKL